LLAAGCFSSRRTGATGSSDVVASNTDDASGHWEEFRAGKNLVLQKRMAGDDWTIRQIVNRLQERNVPQFAAHDQTGAWVDIWLNEGKPGNDKRDPLLETDDVVLVFDRTGRVFRDSHQPIETSQLVSLHRHASVAQADDTMSKLQDGHAIYPTISGQQTVYCLLWGRYLFLAQDESEYIFAVSNALP
jgi:hypothetical protein